jgi:2-haloacid dehalogenase
LDREAVGRLVDDGSLPRESTEVLSRANERLAPWPDTLVGLEALSDFSTVLGLSNASRRVLAALSANAGMRWHQVLSAEDAGTYKPDTALYEAAIASSPSAANDPPMMVAAHAWDLRAAAAAGMRTAYIPRPNGDAPRPDDDFDIVATSLEDFCVQIRR